MSLLTQYTYYRDFLPSTPNTEISNPGHQLSAFSNNTNVKETSYQHQL